MVNSKKSNRTINQKKVKLTNKAIKEDEIVFTLFDYEIHSIVPREEFLKKLDEI